MRAPGTVGLTPVKKTVDVFLKDELVASYPVVVQAIDRPTDADFIERVKEVDAQLLQYR